MTILILHGVYGHAGIHWQQWLHDELVKKGHTVIMPDLPSAEHPDRQVWFITVTDLIKNVDPKDLVIVGHSLGVATALDVIENFDRQIKALISVSGFGEDYGSELNNFFMKERTIDFEKVNKNVAKKFVLYGDNDPYVPQASLSRMAENLHIAPLVIKNGGHLNTDAEFTKFPQLLARIEMII